jgi:erythromycin esterase
MVELTPEEEAQTLAAATRLVEAFTNKRKAFVARSKPGEYAVNLHYAQIIGQAQARYAADTPGQQFTQRDRGMAENVAWIADQIGNNARIMVWAHNGHVRLESEGLLGRSMGSRLRERFEQGYVSIGFVLNRGEYRAVPDPKQPRESVLVPLDASAPGYLAETLSRVGAPIFAIDLRRAPAGPVRDWLSAPHLVHSCGWLVSDAERLGAVASITKQFDLVIYIDQTTGATPLRVQPAERARG